MSAGSINVEDVESISRRKFSKTGLILISLSGVYQYVEVMWREDNALF
jgi:hypothetical protein